jgi:hypothetical protein
VDPAPGQTSLASLGIRVRRNAFGRQVDSTAETLQTSLGPVAGAFIRAPEVLEVGEGIQVLARRGTAADGDGPIVAVGTDTALGLSFHPELTGDDTWTCRPPDPRPPAAPAPGRPHELPLEAGASVVGLRFAAGGALRRRLRSLPCEVDRLRSSSRESEQAFFHPLPATCRT